MKLGKFFFPGLSGVTLWLSSAVLLIKGYKITGLRPIDLPSNWISLHPALRGNAVKEIYDRCRRITLKFAEDILSGRKNYRALFDIIQDILISPVAFLYFFAGRFMIAKSFYANSKCNKCYTCVDNCPVKAIKIVDDLPYWTYKCESCMKCMNECPNRAIETAHGFIIGIMVLINSTILFMLWNLISNLFRPEWNDPLFRNAKWIIDTIVSLFLIFISYRIFHSIKRFPFFRELIEYSSLTRYKFWGRYNVKKIFSKVKKETITQDK
jgi:Pyruvate/2-oxoacid:ferredoxin oxidoreductase delta subunit